MNGHKNSYCTYCKGNDNSIMKFFSSFGKVISFLKWIFNLERVVGEGYWKFKWLWGNLQYWGETRFLNGAGEGYPSAKYVIYVFISSFGIYQDNGKPLENFWQSILLAKTKWISASVFLLLISSPTLPFQKPTKKTSNVPPQHLLCELN